jgi:ferredoxin
MTNPSPRKRMDASEITAPNCHASLAIRDIIDVDLAGGDSSGTLDCIDADDVTLDDQRCTTRAKSLEREPTRCGDQGLRFAHRRTPAGDSPTVLAARRGVGLPDDTTISGEDFGLRSLTVDVTTPSLTHRSKSRPELGIGGRPLAEPVRTRLWPSGTTRSLTRNRGEALMPTVSVDAKLCAGHAICTILDSAVFNLDEKAGVARVDAAAAAAASSSRMKDIVAACPAGAISVENA